MKRKLALFLAFIMILGILPINVFAAKPARLVQENDKAYEEVTIDGMPYKVYKVADLIDKPIEKNIDSLMFKPISLFKAQGTPTPTQPYSGWKFFLKLTWETIDRPINNVIMPVYVGDPTNSRSIKLGQFVVTTGADEDQYIEMDIEYTGTKPSIDDLVSKAFNKMKIAIPEDMRYDFVLASAKWDESVKEGIENVNQKVVFTIEGKQSVMHGFGIKWYDTDASNRDKIDAKWGGLVGQELNAKMATEDRNYSAYILNKIDRTNPGRLQHYPDGSEYTPFDYYYNGEKITTNADAENQGKFDNNQLAIGPKSDRSNAKLTVDGKRHGEKVLKNNTKYFYDSVGDYRTFHVLSMREALKVKFNSGKGSLTDGGEANQEIGTAQEIGHSETIANNESGRTINVPTTNLVPPAAEAGKPANEFIGWALTADATTALFKTQEEANAYATPFTDKTTTFYAIYAPKDEVRAKVEYVYDDNGTEKTIDKKYLKDENDANYQTIIKGNNAGDAVQVADVKVPTFIGFERTNDNINVTGKTYKNEKDDNKLDVIKVKFKKLDSVIPEKDPKGGKDKTKPEGYVTVTFKAGDHGKINGGTADVNFFVNPKDEVKFGDSNIKVPTIEAVGDYIVKTPNWNPDLNNTKKEEKITDNAEFVAQYEAKAKHTVTFDADNETAKTTEQVVDGKTATKPATDPTKNGYTFKEWQLVTDGNVSGTAYDFGTAVKSDITLKAVYTENQVKIEYVSEDTSKGTVDKAEETIGAITGAPTGSTLGSTATAMDGYRFTHWTKDGDNNFKVKTEKVTPEKTNEIYAAAKFTAHFAKEVSVKYDLNAPSGLTAKGTAPTDNTKYIAGEKADVKALPQGAGVDGCEFLGWSTDKSATAATYKANDKIDITGEKDVTLYGVWKKGTKTVNLTFEFYKKKDSGNVQQPENALGNFKKPELKNLTGQEVGAVITFPTYQGQTVNTGDLQGTWTFDGWYKNGVKVTGQQTVSATDADNQYVGKWILEETKTAKVSHVFKIDPSIVGDDKVVKSTHELPQGVKDQKRQDTTNYVGSIVNPISKPAFTAVEEKIGDKIGTWTFVEWDKDQLTVSATEADNVFTGTWTWTEKGKVNVNYVFEKIGTDRNLPKDITELKPTDLTGDKAVYEEQVQGKKPNLPATTSFDVVEDGNKVGTWTAGTWSNATKVDDNNYKYTLVWTFTEVGQSDQPTVDPVKPGDKKITGKGKAGSDIVVELPDGTKVPGKVDKNGDWTVEVPKDKDLKDGDKIKVTQKEKDKKPSDPVDVTVGSKKPEPQPEPKPEPKPLPEVEIPGIKYKDHKVPTYPVKTVVPGIVKPDTLWYIFHIDKYDYEEVRNNNSTSHKMDVTPVIRNERTMLPLRYVAEAIGADVKWDPETRTATFAKDGLIATIQIDSDEIVLSNGKTVKMDSKPLNINDRILVSVVNVGNVFGLTNGNTLDGVDQDIEWDHDTRTATIYIRR